MKIIDKVKAAFHALTRPSVSLNDPELLDWLGINPKSKALNEVTYFTCMKMLTETMGKLRLNSTSAPEKEKSGQSLTRLRSYYDTSE